jgi:hypothetical protein
MFYGLLMANDGPRAQCNYPTREEVVACLDAEVKRLRSDQQWLYWVTTDPTALPAAAGIGPQTRYGLLGGA